MQQGAGKCPRSKDIRKKEVTYSLKFVSLSLILKAQDITLERARYELQTRLALPVIHERHLCQGV
jgi:hypothetical protein